MRGSSVYGHDGRYVRSDAVDSLVAVIDLLTKGRAFIDDHNSVVGVDNRSTCRIGDALLRGNWRDVTVEFSRPTVLAIGTQRIPTVFTAPYNVAPRTDGLA